MHKSVPNPDVPKCPERQGPQVFSGVVSEQGSLLTVAHSEAAEQSAKETVNNGYTEDMVVECPV